MLVLVRYTDDNFDIIEDYRLEYLIITGKVAEFSRSDQWVSVGKAPTREKTSVSEWSPSDTQEYTGPERRRNPHKNILHISQTAATT